MDKPAVLLAVRLAWSAQPVLAARLDLQLVDRPVSVVKQVLDLVARRALLARLPLPDRRALLARLDSQLAAMLVLGRDRLVSLARPVLVHRAPPLPAVG